MLTVQTDNGSDLVGSANQKPSKTSAFEAMARFLGVKHVRIPPRRPTWNSEVESFHRTCEDEFYDTENFAHRAVFFGKAATYQLFYNTERKNRWRDNKTPLELIEQLAPNIDSQRVVNLRPVALGALIDHGYHLPASPSFFYFSLDSL
jgi:transposase InsO family protein